MRLKNISLALLMTAVNSFSGFNPLFAAANPANSGVYLKRVSNESHEVAAIDAGAQDALAQRLAAAKIKFDELSSIVQEKSDKVTQASDALRTTISLAHQRTAETLKATEELEQAKSALESSEAYFLVTKLDPNDRTALMKLYAENLQITSAKKRAAESIKTMSDNIEKYKAELNEKKVELDSLNAEILAAANAEYTPPAAEVKQEEMLAKQAALAAAQAKHAELSAVINNLTAKINAANTKLKQLESRIPAAKAAKTVDKGVALNAITVEQKGIKTQKLTDEEELKEATLQLDLAAKQATQLEDAIAVLKNDIASLPAAMPGVDAAAGESLADKLKRLPVLKSRIMKLEASQDPKGKLQTALEKAKEALKDLEAQGIAKDNEIRSFKDVLVAKRTGQITNSPKVNNIISAAPSAGG